MDIYLLTLKGFFVHERTIRTNITLKLNVCVTFITLYSVLHVHVHIYSRDLLAI